MANQAANSKAEFSYIRGFDGVRGLSIIMVLLSHIGLYDVLNLGTRSRMLCDGTTGVLVFFTLSGFLITRLLLAEKEQTGSVYLLRFFGRRFLRLFPPLAVFYSLTIILMLQGSISREPVGLLLSAVYLYNFVPHRYYSGELGHLWSLAVEEQFYFTWPFIVRTLSHSKILATGFATIALCTAINVVIDRTNSNPVSHQLNWLTSNFFLHRWFIPAAGPILIGSLAALLNTRKTSQPRISARWCLLSGVLFAYPLLALKRALAFAPFIQSTGCAVFLIWLVHNQGSTIARWLEFTPIRYLGRISYGVYVYQGLFLRTGPGSKLPIQIFPLNLVLTLTLAVISYHSLEKYFLGLKKNLRSIS